MGDNLEAKDGDDWNGLKMSAKFWLTRLAYLCLDCQITLLFFTFFFLQLAVNSVDVIVHGNSDCDSSQHSHCPNEYDLHTGQESRSSGIWCGSYFTAHSHGEISFSGKWQRTEIEFWNVLSQEDCSPSCSLVFWVRECTRVCRVLLKTGLSFFCYMLNVHYAKNVSSRRLGLRQRNSAVGILSHNDFFLCRICA